MLSELGWVGFGGGCWDWGMEEFIERVEVGAKSVGFGGFLVKNALTNGT